MFFKKKPDTIIEDIVVIIALLQMELEMRR
jgi:hypothetical protein